MPCVQSNGLSVHFTDTGDGVPVILLAGLGAGCASWPVLGDLLATRYRCIALDNRGVGQSDGCRRWHRIADLAEDVIAVLDHLGIERAHVVGNSMGGAVAQCVAVRFPERVATLVLLAASAGLPSIPMHPSALYRLAAALLMRGAGRQRMLASVMLGSRSRRRGDEVPGAQPDGFLPPRSTGLVRQMAAVARWSGMRALPRIRIPTLVVHGREDHIIPMTNARIMAARLPLCRLVLVPGAGHFILSDAPAEVAAAVTGFLAAPRVAHRASALRGLRSALATA